MFQNHKVALIIPALDEQDAIGPVVESVDREVVDDVIVVDNGSQDLTGQRAAHAGATVVFEARRGYGSACLAGIARASQADILVFMDGDGSDDPAEIERMLEILFEEDAELVVGSRVLGCPEAGALTHMQRFGNSLTCNLVKLFWGVGYTDLGPFRAIRREALEQLSMNDPDFGWTIEMQVKAATRGLRVIEMPVSCRVRRAGRSKVSGTVLGSYRAGKTILGYVFGAKLREWFSGD
jgi:glycosyltransferase involved in cell wall biosynthesis